MQNNHLNKQDAKDIMWQRIPLIPLRDRFKSVIAEIEGPGDFAVGGPISTSFGLPAIELNNGTTIGLPLNEPQAKEIISIASKSPFGRGEATFYDDNIRKSWQLDPSQFTIKNPDWNSMLQVLLQEKVISGLGVPQKIICSLYKLLLYEQGGHFKIHRDTEKENGMFGTMIIQLPCSYTGGEIIVEHNRRTQIFDFTSKAICQPYFSAFYADCQHEIKEVTSGYRICLVYNLVYAGPNAIEVKDQGIIMSKLKQLCNDWEKDNSVSKMIYMLEHQYSTSGLSFKTLKGKDLLVAQALKRLKEDGHIDLYLTILKKTVEGHSIDPYDEFDSDDATYELLNWCSVDDSHFNIRNMDVDEKEIFSTKNSDSMEYTGQTSFDTGNEGSEVTKWYRQAALVYWPIQKELDIWSNTDIPSALYKLELMVKASDPRCDLFTLKIIRMISSLNYWERNVEQNVTRRLTIAIIQLNNVILAKEFISTFLVGAQGTVDVQYMNVLSNLVTTFSWDGLKESIQYLFSKLKVSITLALQLVNVLHVIYQKKNQTSLLKEVLNSALVNTAKDGTSKAILQEIISIWEMANKYDMLEQMDNFLKLLGSNHPLKQIIEILQSQMTSTSPLTIEQTKILASASANNIRMYSRETGADIVTLISIISYLQLTETLTKLFEDIENNIGTLKVYKILHELLNRKFIDQSQRLATALYNHIDSTSKLPHIKKMVQFVLDLLQLNMPQLLQMLVTKLVGMDKKIILTKVKDLIIQLSQRGVNIEQDNSLKQLRDYCVDTIRQAKTKSFRKIVGYNLNVQIKCSCSTCQDAQKILNDPVAKTYQLKSRKQDRKHVETSIRGVTMEVTYDTITTQGAPHTFICTKKISKSKRKQRCLQLQQRLLEEVLQAAPVQSTSTTAVVVPSTQTTVITPTTSTVSGVRGPPPTSDAPPSKKAKLETEVIEID
jgi:hypothetical protein